MKQLSKKIIGLLFLFAINKKNIHAQCLLSNGGFEQIINCSAGFDYNEIINWTQPHRTSTLHHNVYTSTPDYFNACEVQFGFPCHLTTCVPVNMLGYQETHGGGGVCRDCFRLKAY